MKWIKKGHIFKPSGEFEWSKEYAQVPRPLVLEDRVRIYYATRFYDNNRIPISQTSFVDVDKIDLTKIIYIHNKPILELGTENSFSQYGIHPTMLIKKLNETVLFYQGWKRSEEYPYETAIGSAISIDNGFSFKKTGQNPIFQKSLEDPYFVNGVFILDENEKYSIFYSGGVSWIESEGRKESIYIIKNTESKDLFNWKNSNKNIIEQVYEFECQNTPTVIKINNIYHMWFSYRQALNFRNIDRGYRIGYAWSNDLINWQRDDTLSGIDFSQGEQWDSQMICYPYVFKIESKIIMLYSGNYFGKDGFGYAELEF